MNKTEFMAYLEKRLSVLNQKEREDIIQEYSQHIDIKVSNGMTEQEAIENFGDIKSFVDEILEAYNIDPHYNDGYTKKQSVLGSIKNIFNGREIKKIYSAIGNIPTKGLWFSIMKLCILAIVAVILFILGLSVVVLIAEELNYNITNFMYLDHLVSFGFIAMYIIFYISIAFAFFNNYITNNFSAKGFKRKAKSNKTDFTDEVNNVNEIKKDNANSGVSEVLRFFVTAIIFLFRLGVLIVLLPYAFALVGCMVMQGVFIVALFSGYPAWGLTIGTLGVNLCGLSLLAMIIRLIFISGNNVEERDLVEE